MKSNRIWSPLNKICRDSFLYHYTTFDNAIKIIYNNALLFGFLKSTNDIFEQKAKIFSESGNLNEMETHEKIKMIRDFFNYSRKNIQLLCFSRDSEEVNLNNSLSKDYKLANVIGRGFALPRMWAQYAENNAGVCFIFNKDKIIEMLSDYNYIALDVKYIDGYEPNTISAVEINKLAQMIESKNKSIITNMIKNKSSLIINDLFYKLSDWKTENEFRIIIEASDTERTKILDISDTIEGILVGQNTRNEYIYLLKQLVAGKNRNIPIRKLVYDNLIIKISET